VEVEESLRQIERCRCPSGLYRAVPADSGVIVPVYRNVWIRDTVYTLLAFESVGDIDRLREGVYALLDRVLLRWAYRLDWRIVEGVPERDIEYLHPRYQADGSEVPGELWGLRQDDAVGLALWALGRWQERFGIFRNDYEDFHLLQKLVWYLDCIDHPHVPDAGIWEEEGPIKAVHLSSVAAVAAGLTQAARIGVKDIPERLQRDTVGALLAMGGRESQHHDTDLALLTSVTQATATTAAGTGRRSGRWAWVFWRLPGTRWARQSALSGTGGGFSRWRRRRGSCPRAGAMIRAMRSSTTPRCAGRTRFMSSSRPSWVSGGPCPRCPPQMNLRARPKREVRDPARRARTWAGGVVLGELSVDLVHGRDPLWPHPAQACLLGACAAKPLA